MNKSLKKIMVTGASLLMLAGVNAVLSHHNVSAANINLQQYSTSWEIRDGIQNWTVSPKNGFHRNPRGWEPLVNFYAKRIRKGHHTFIVKAANDTKGAIIGIDGTTHVSNAKVFRALRNSRSRRHYRKHARHAVRKNHRRIRKHSRRRHAKRHARRHGRRRRR